MRLGNSGLALAIGSAVVIAIAVSTASGTNGIPGMSGVEGEMPPGMSGMQGMSGMSGMSGMQGMSGMSGMSGMQGMLGLSGMQALPGMQGMYGQTWMPGMYPMTGMHGMYSMSGKSEVPLKSKDEAQALANQVMDWFTKDNVVMAIDAMGTHIPTTQLDQMQFSQRIQQARERLTQRYGPADSYGLVRTEEIKDFIVRYTFVEQRPNNFTRWSMTFYRPMQRWLLLRIVWDEGLDGLLQ